MANAIDPNAPPCAICGLHICAGCKLENTETVRNSAKRMLAKHGKSLARLKD